MRLDLRLVIPALVAWITAGLSIAQPSIPVPIVLISWAVAVALVLTRRRWLVITGVSCAALALVVSAVALHGPARHPAVLAEAGPRQVELELVTTQTIVAGAEYFAATARTVTVGETTTAIDVPVVVFTAATERIGIGATVLIAGTLREAPREDDVAYLVFGDELTVERGPPGWIEWGNALRERFADAAATLPGDGGALLPGLAIGDTTAVGADLDAAMKASSLSHLTAVSGANCAVVVGLALLAGAALGLRRPLRIGIAIAVLVGFVVLVTPEPSVLRAGVMALLVLAAALSGRPTRGLPLLATAVLVLVVIDPWLSRNYGFVLSVLATGALLTLAGPLARVLARWLPLPLATVIAVPVAAQLACQPVLILLNSTIPLYGVVANLLAEPAAPVATVLGLAACLALPVFEPLGIVLAWVAWVPAAWISAVASFFAGLPGNNVPWLDGLPGLALLAVLTAAGVTAVLTGRRRVRVAAASVVVVLVVVMGSAAVGSRVTELLTRPATGSSPPAISGRGTQYSCAARRASHSWIPGRIRNCSRHASMNSASTGSTCSCSATTTSTTSAAPRP